MTATRVKATITREPILTGGVSLSALVLAGIALVNAVWPGTVSDQQRDALVGLLVLLWPVLLAMRQAVTPVRDPRP